MKYRYLILALLAAALCFAAPALAAEQSPAHEVYPGAPASIGIPGLTVEQQKALIDIRAKHQKAFLAQGQKLYQKRAELNAVLAAPEPDAKKAKALAAEIGKLLGEQYEHRIAMQLELREKGLAMPGMMGGGMMGGMMGGGMMGGGMMGGMHGGMMGGGMRGGMMGPGMMGPGMVSPMYDFEKSDD